MLQPVIKWTGSKRSQAESIISYFPNKIRTYYEPFIGGGSVMYRLLYSDIEAENIECSDVNSDLINFYNTLKSNPTLLCDSYSVMWHEMNSLESINERKEYYYGVRKRFNNERKPDDFLFLSRTCTNGLIRYNSKGQFNTSLHFTRKGIEPLTLSGIIREWSTKLNQRRVNFTHRSYSQITSEDGDVIYLDPPYATDGGAVYFGSFNHNELWDWMNRQKGIYLLSFNGTQGDNDITYDVPNNLYRQHVYLHSGRSSFNYVVHKETETVTESLYVK